MPSMPSNRDGFVPRHMRQALIKASTSVTVAASTAMNFASDTVKFALAEASEAGGWAIRFEKLRREVVLRPLCAAAIFVDSVFLPSHMSQRYVAPFPCTPEGALREPLAIIRAIADDPHNAELAEILDGRMLSNILIGLSGADFVRVCYVLRAVDATGAASDIFRLNVMVKNPGCNNDSLLVRSRQCAWDDARELSFYREYQELLASVERASGIHTTPERVIANFRAGIDYCPVVYRSVHWRGMLVPVCVPKPLAMAANMWVGKQLLILCAEQDEMFSAFNDWTGFSYMQCRLVVTRAARFHASNWRPDVYIATFVHHRGGYEFLSYSKALGHLHFSRYYVPLQHVIRRLVKKYAAPPIKRTRDGEDSHSQSAGCDPPAAKRIPLCLCHGDLRPATVMFHKSFISAVTPSGLASTMSAAATARPSNSPSQPPVSPVSEQQRLTPQPTSSSTPPDTGSAAIESLHAFFDSRPEDVILFSDWGSVTVAPFLWDFTYCCLISLNTNCRRRYQWRLLDDYIRELTENGMLPPGELPPLDVCRRWVDVLSLAMVLVVWALEQTDLLHENDEILRLANQDLRDFRAQRVTAAAIDVLQDLDGLAAFMECDRELLRLMKTELTLFSIF